MVNEQNHTNLIPKNDLFTNYKIVNKKLTFFYFNRVAANKKFTMLVSPKSTVHLYANIP